MSSWSPPTNSAHTSVASRLPCSNPQAGTLPSTTRLLSHPPGARTRAASFLTLMTVTLESSVLGIILTATGRVIPWAGAALICILARVIPSGTLPTLSVPMRIFNSKISMPNLMPSKEEAPTPNALSPISGRQESQPTCSTTAATSQFAHFRASTSSSWSARQSTFAAFLDREFQRHQDWMGR